MTEQSDPQALRPFDVAQGNQAQDEAGEQWRIEPPKRKSQHRLVTGGIERFWVAVPDAQALIDTLNTLERGLAAERQRAERLEAKAALVDDVVPWVQWVCKQRRAFDTDAVKHWLARYDALTPEEA